MEKEEYLRKMPCLPKYTIFTPKLTPEPLVTQPYKISENVRKSFLFALIINSTIIVYNIFKQSWEETCEIHGKLQSPLWLLKNGHDRGTFISSFLLKEFPLNNLYWRADSLNYLHEQFQICLRDVSGIVLNLLKARNRDFERQIWIYFLMTY